jgi:hypothetical protein
VPVVSDEDGSAPEHEALLADSVGLALLAVLDPDVVRRADRAALPAGAATERRGAQAVAEETRTNSQRARFAQPALVNGTVDIVVAPRGQLLLALRLTIKDDKIAEIDVIADPRASTSSTWPSSSTD